MAGAQLIEVKVQSLGLDRNSNTPVVILQEKGGSRVLPIWIGPGEASAIAMHLAGMKFARPLTHDLFTTVLRGLGGKLKRVMITRVVENTYYAELIIQRETEVFSVDARPSDSIAIALRAKATIFVADDLLDNTHVEISEADEEGGGLEEGELGGARAELLGADRHGGPVHEDEPVVDERRDAVTPEPHGRGLYGVTSRSVCPSRPQVPAGA